MDIDNINILIVDDSTLIHKIISSFLSSSNYKLFSAYDGKEALLLIEKEDIDLILSDINMPNMNGFEFCKVLKNSKHKRIPFIFLTAEQKQDDIVKGHELGANDYISKPFNKDELEFRVKKQIRISCFEENIRKDEKRHQHLAMIATLGHELNNSLTILNGGLAKLKSKKSYDQASIDKMTKSSEHIEDVVKKLTELDPEALSYEEYAEGIDKLSL